VIAHIGSLEKTRSFFRFYMIPGREHGNSGPGIQNTPSLLDVVRAWRENGTVPEMLPGKRVVGGKTELEMPLYPYPKKSVWDAATSSFKPVEGPRGGVDRVAASFRPAAAE
jgi:feruloyl esterase